MKNLIKTVPLAIIMLFATVSCDNGFEDLAANPNAPSVQDFVPADLLIAGAQVELSYRTHYHVAINYLGLWVQHHASGAYPDEDQYSPRLNDMNVYWDNIYDNPMRDFKQMLETFSFIG